MLKQFKNLDERYGNISKVEIKDNWKLMDVKLSNFVNELKNGKIISKNQK